MIDRWQSKGIGVSDKKIGEIKCHHTYTYCLYNNPYQMVPRVRVFMALGMRWPNPTRGSRKALVRVCADRLGYRVDRVDVDSVF